MTGGDPSAVEGDCLDGRHPLHYSFNGQNSELSLDGMFPHNNSSTATTTPASFSHWSSPLLPPIPSHFPSDDTTRERSHTTAVLPSSFPAHGSTLQSQLPLPPLISVGNGSGVPHRPSGPNSQSGNSSNYLQTLTSAFYPRSSSNDPLNSPSLTNTSSGYLPNTPSTRSSTSTGTADDGDTLLTPPHLTYDLPRPAVGEFGFRGNYYGWEGK